MAKERKCPICSNMTHCEIPDRYLLGLPEPKYSAKELYHIISGDKFIMKCVSMHPQIPSDVKKLLERKVAFLEEIVENGLD